jgi:NAD(P)-dependent dehydrogenase (short-subunit alcohol dehydrogenase family)
MREGDVTVVIGAGPGLGAAVARRFAREGHALALIARRAETLDEARRGVAEASAAGAPARPALCIAADATDAASVSAALRRVRDELGEPGVLVYNAGAFQPGSVVDVTPETFERSWRANCLGAFLSARELLPAMIQRGRGTVLLTGATASLRGAANFACLAVGKFGLRALAQSMARELGPKGVHVAHVIVDGMIDTARVRGMVPGRSDDAFLSPDAIAEVYWQLHAQPKSAWTLELDVRPAVEKF